MWGYYYLYIRVLLSTLCGAIITSISVYYLVPYVGLLLPLYQSLHSTLCEAIISSISEYYLVPYVRLLLALYQSIT